MFSFRETVRPSRAHWPLTGRNSRSLWPGWLTSPRSTGRWHSMSYFPYTPGEWMPPTHWTTRELKEESGAGESKQCGPRGTKITDRRLSLIVVDASQTTTTVSDGPQKNVSAPTHHSTHRRTQSAASLRWWDVYSFSDARGESVFVSINNISPTNARDHVLGQTRHRVIKCQQHRPNSHLPIISTESVFKSLGTRTRHWE